MESVLMEEKPTCNDSNGKYKRKNYKVANILCHLATFVEFYDLQSLFGCIRAFEVSLAMPPNISATLSMIEALSMVSFSPIWGIVADCHEIRYVLSSALLISGTMSIFLGFTTKYAPMLIFRAFNGMAMGSIAPVSQKLLILTTPPESQCTAFGLLHATMCAGRFLSAVITVYFSQKIIMGLYGWRVCFLFFGLVALVIALVILIFMEKLYENETSEAGIPGVSVKNSLMTNVRKGLCHLKEGLYEIFATKTSRIMFLQVYISDAPFCAFGFMTLCLQYIGQSDFMSGAYSALVILGGLLGGAFGGSLFDFFHEISPKYGRLALGNISIFIRVLFFYLFFFKVPPPSGSKISWQFVICLLIIGASFMVVSCVDRPILADVVRPCYHASSIAVSRGLAGIASSLMFTPLTAHIAERYFGYETTTLSISDMPRGLARKNASAYGNSIFYMSVVGSIASFLLYFWMMYTYWPDVQWTAERGRASDEKELDAPARTISPE